MSVVTSIPFNRQYYIYILIFITVCSLLFTGSSNQEQAPDTLYKHNGKSRVTLY